MSDDVPRTPTGSPILLKGRLLMLYAGAGNKFVSRHLELHPGKLHVLLDGTSEPQQIISLTDCLIADYPEHAQMGFALCRNVSTTAAQQSATSEPGSPSRLGQLVFVCFRVEHKQLWMERIQEQIWMADDTAAAAATKVGAAASAVKQSRLNKFRFNSANYVIDRGARPPLLQNFVLKRTGRVLQDYVVRWCELRDRISSETVTSLGGIIYATYAMAPPGGWSVVPMRIDSAIARTVEKCRICVSGPNQDTVYFKFSTREQMEEWAGTLDMLIERAKLENDPQFAMQMKLGDGSGAQRNEQHGKADADELESTMTAAQLRKLQVGGDSDGAVGGMNLGFDSDDDGDDASAARSPKQKRLRPPNLDFDAEGDSYGEDDEEDEEMDEEDDADSNDTEYEVRDLAAETPRRRNYAKMLYSLDRVVHADRDSHKVIPMLREVVNSPPSRFRPDISPYVPRGGGGGQHQHNHQSQSQQQRRQQQHGDGGFLAHDVSSSFSTYDGQAALAKAHPGSPAPGEEVSVTVEDVLERFERRLHIAVELLGPGAVVQRLLTELDTDASDLKYVAIHVLDTFPRQVRAAQIAAKIDDALNTFNAIRESVLVRADMARFREDFRISSSTIGAGAGAGGAGSSGSGVVASPNSAGPGSGGASGSSGGGASIRPPPKTSDSAATLTVDDALKVINRVTIEKSSGGGKSGDSTSKLRDAIQFLTHFMTQFREAFDVYDDAGYIIEEVGGAIDRATRFLQEI